ncbi:aminoglycoside phosphotransferase family protein [Kitasatospora sp. NPDC101176]|uniref:aminoglycoside phosphotransferase family protein n=1 Tax=Kitasatospora sp. NPDC101176 TaxID=3364099 RepID=UPI0038220B08
MQRAAERTVTVHLTHEGEYFGPLGPFEAEGGWWSSVAPVVERASELAGVPVLVTRLVEGRSANGGHGGRVDYHAEALARPAGLAARLPEERTAALLGPAERRAAWATPPGLRDALDWARTGLALAGRPATGPARQIRTWNLSALFRIPTTRGDAWLKTTTPAFNAREGEVIALLGGVDPSLVPPVLAADAAAGRLLLDHVPGEDCWGPSADTVADVVPRLVAVQAALAADGRAASAGLRDRTPRTLLARAGALLERLPGVTDLTPGELADVRRLVEELPGRLDELADCGFPETLVHGDFHPGNWRSDGEHAVVVDFADSCLGHPALDGLRPRAYLVPERWEQFAGVWGRAWREHVPGVRPERALELVEPLYHLSYAVRYQEFLDHIEASERPYHEGDPAAELRAALACAAPGRG